MITLSLLAHGENHEKMMAAVKALKEVGVYELPDKLAKYFKCSIVDEVAASGGVLEIGSCTTSYNTAVFSGILKYSSEIHEGFDICIKDLPKGVDVVRVFNSH